MFDDFELLPCTEETVEKKFQKTLDKFQFKETAKIQRSNFVFNFRQTGPLTTFLKERSSCQ
jgi:hypothetical protein